MELPNDNTGAAAADAFNPVPTLPADPPPVDPVEDPKPPNDNGAAVAPPTVAVVPAVPVDCCFFHILTVFRFRFGFGFGVGFSVRRGCG